MAERTRENVLALLLNVGRGTDPDGLPILIFVTFAATSAPVISAVVVGVKKNSSTRRFLAMFSGDVSSASGRREPTPSTVMTAPGIPSDSRKDFRAAARSRAIY